MSRPPVRRSQPASLHVELAAGQRSLNRLLARFEAFARERRMPAGARRNLLLVLDEIVSNVVHHGCSRATSCRVSVDIVVERGVAAIEIVDNGRPFDPLSARSAPVQGSAAERPIGGLGIRLVRALMDGVEYQRRNGKNRLRMQYTFKKRDSHSSFHRFS